ncbi:MAG: recombinase family protein [Vicinamibacterales bacterium]
MIAAIYARKSTEQHGVADDAKSITRQIDGARRFIAEKGWTLDEAHIYCDDGVSGALFANRVEFQRMLTDAKADAFGSIVFFDLDRFGRHAHHTMTALHNLADISVDVWDFSTGVRVNLDSFEGRISTTL